MDQATLSAARRNSLHVFIVAVFQHLHGEGTFQDSWHIQAMANLAEQLWRGEVIRAIVTVPPRNMKTIVFSIALVAFVLGHDPSAKLICISYTQEMANMFHEMLKRVVESPWYMETFPDMVVAKDTEGLLVTTAGGFRFATSPGGSVTGLGADYIILDDPIKPEDATSRSARDRVYRYFQQTLFSRLNDKARGRILWVMQRLHEDDPIGRLLTAGGWYHLCLPAIATKDELIPIGYGRIHDRRVGDILHPEREPLELLEDTRRQLGSANFEAQYQQEPVPAAGLYIKAEWLHRYTKLPDLRLMKIAQSWDTAMTGSSQSDYSVCTTWGELKGRQYLIELHRFRLDQPLLIAEVVRLYQEYSPHALLIEKHGSGIGIIQSLQHSYRIRATPIVQTVDKMTRLVNVTPMFERGDVLLPIEKPWLPPLESELLGFPNARHDDQVDSISQYLTWARGRYGSSEFQVFWT